MAPEQAAGDPDVDPRADVYAWGVVAYELLAGAPPFAGRAAHQLVAAHIGEPPPPLAARAPDAPPALVALVMRCLEKDPARRPQSAGELLAELDAARTPSARSRSRARRRLAAGRASPPSPARPSFSSLSLSLLRRMPGARAAPPRRSRRCSPCCRSRISGSLPTRTSPTGSPTR